MGRKSYVIICVGVLVRLLACLPGEARAGVDLNISINAGLPVYAAPAPPVVVAIPGTYVYFAPDLGVDVLFYHGSWYRPYQGRWYWGRSYNGPWAFVAPGRVPRALVALPPGYRRAYGRGDRIPYGQLKKNWARWERERHWDERAERHDEGRHGHEGRDHGHGRWD